ncbi:ABC transporter permease subunit [Thiolinea disciformis]|uniref:ABC transporter permease subunit n=1 Tax=Thiolinea disciformis TaxID=125614 RepID=UPI0003632678|nr:ABC transporter permease subunit [Thiolinea disciformis]
MRKLGYLVLLLQSGVTVLAFYGLLRFDNTHLDLSLFKDPYLQAIIGFSLKQAVLSSVLSVTLGLMIARLLYYTPHLWAKNLFLTLCLLCFVLPSFVLITGLVVLLGQSGWLTPYLGESWNLYGLKGILIAHVFLNMPYVVRVIYLHLNQIPASSWMLARQLKLSRWEKIKYLEWGALKATITYLLGFIFILCFNSFAVVLALGGGPQATTLELAIYQALKYSFNLSEAVTLAWLQCAIAGGALLFIIRFNKFNWLSPTNNKIAYLPEIHNSKKFLAYLLYTLLWLILLLPLLALLPESISVNWKDFAFKGLLEAVGTSLALSFISAVSSLFLAYFILLLMRYARKATNKYQKIWLDFLANQHMVAPTMVLSTGIYIYLLNKIDIEQWGVFVLILLNTLLILPFILQNIRTSLLSYDDQYVRLVSVLKLSFRVKVFLEFRALQPVVVHALIVGILLVLGDIAVFALFGNKEWSTLPWLIYSYIGSYKLSEASLVSTIFLLLCLFLVLQMDKHNKDIGSNHA